MKKEQICRFIDCFNDSSDNPSGHIYRLERWYIKSIKDNYMILTLHYIDRTLIIKTYCKIILKYPRKPKIYVLIAYKIQMYSRVKKENINIKLINRYTSNQDGDANQTCPVCAYLFVR